MMHAVILRGPEEVTYEEVPVPEVGPGDVLIRVESALTCGTDLKVFMLPKTRRASPNIDLRKS